jgi:hypothetical protein
MPGNLRELLEAMTAKDISVEDQTHYLEEISKSVPHGIRLLPSPDDEPLDDYNCVMYALDIVGCFAEPCSPLGRYYADTAFLSALIDSGDLVPAKESDGTIVVWSADGTIKHVGIVVSPGRAASKWGRGHLYEHGLFEVPQSYGDGVKFFKRPSFDQASEMLRSRFGK